MKAQVIYVFEIVAPKYKSGRFNFREMFFFQKIEILDTREGDVMVKGVEGNGALSQTWLQICLLKIVSISFKI